MDLGALSSPVVASPSDLLGLLYFPSPWRYLCKRMEVLKSKEEGVEGVGVQREGGTRKLFGLGGE